MADVGSDGVVEERAAFSAATMDSGRLLVPFEICEFGRLCQFNPRTVALLEGDNGLLARLFSASRGDSFSLEADVE